MTGIEPPKIKTIVLKKRALATMATMANLVILNYGSDKTDLKKQEHYHVKIKVSLELITSWQLTYSSLPNCRRPLNKRRRGHNPENQ